MAVPVRGAHGSGMSKRVFAAILWFYTGWYAGAFITAYLGVSPLIGPILGAAAASLFVGYPRRIIWSRRVSAAQELAPEAA
jgi:hypothetical protein